MMAAGEFPSTETVGKSVIYQKAVDVRILPSSQNDLSNNCDKSEQPLSNLSRWKSLGLPLPNSASFVSLVKLTITVAQLSGGGGGGANGSSTTSVLRVTLTDESNPFFLYTLDLGHADYQQLKSDQNLLIEFSQFPSKFIELLDLCISGSAGRDGSDTISSAASGGRFSAQFSMSDSGEDGCDIGFFSIIESNSFRNISHLCLRMDAANDQAIKTYLADLVYKYRSSTERLRNDKKTKEDSLISELDSTRRHLAGIESDYQLLQSTSTAKVQQLEEKHRGELENEHQNFEKEYQQLRHRFDEEKRALSTRYEERVEALKADQTRAVSQLQDMKFKLESTELRFSKVENENSILRSEISSLKQGASQTESTNAVLSNEQTRLLKDLNDKKMKIESLEKSVNECKETIVNLEKDKLIATADFAKMEAVVSDRTAQLKSTEDMLQNERIENEKANEIIRKMHQESKSLRTKLKQKSSSLEEFESRDSHREASVKSLEEELGQLRATFEKKDEQYKSLELSLAQLKAQTERDKKVIEENNNVIEWLHRQLNEESVKNPKLSENSRMNTDVSQGRTLSKPGEKLLATTIAHRGPKKESSLPFRSSYFK